MQELPVHQRGDAVSSLVYEANARARDPVYGCVGAISYLQNQVSQLQMQLAVAQAEILCIQNFTTAATTSINIHDHLMNMGDDDDDKSYFLQNNLPQLLNFSAAPNSSNVIYDSFKRESSLYGHDMVS